MRNWTPQQKAAIADRGRSVIVSAAAGSGKTAVLVERLLEILSDTAHPVRADAIIVVTFTNDAADQMRERLSAALEQKMLAETDDNAYNWLFAQSTRLHHAKISTINAFCFDLIRENADACGISNAFRILEPAEESGYEESAMHKVLSRWGSERQEDMEQLYAVLCSRDDHEIPEIVYTIKEYLDSTAFPEIWTEQAKQICMHPGILTDMAAKAVCEELERILAFAEKAYSHAQAAHAVFEEIWREDVTGIRFQLDHLRSADPHVIQENPTVHTVHFARFSNKKNGVDCDARAVFKSFRDVYKKWYEDAVTNFLGKLAYQEQDAQIEKRVIPLLLELTEEYMDVLLNLKLEQNELGFSDGERLALNLLGQVTPEGGIVPTPLAQQLSESYALIMVDEYQDSNDKQDCLFKLLSKNGRYDPARSRLLYGTNAFLVGDVKQSIYRFRQANPKNFMHALEDSCPAEACKAGDTARMYLSRNFRSAQGVIDFINGLFACTMSGDCGDVDYNKNEYLNFGASQYQNMENTRTRLIFPEKQGEDEQVLCTADCIRDMLIRRVPVMENGCQRPCEPKDFCILMRSVKKAGPLLQQALRERGIPCMGEEAGSFLQSPEIRLIGNILQALDNPLTDMAMAAVLLSPVYGFSAQDLIELKSKTDITRLYRQIITLAAMEEDSPLHDRCCRFLKQFDRLRSLADALPLDELIREIYEETDLLSLQSLYSDADRRRENLERYPRMAAQYQDHAEQNGRSSLGGWLRYLAAAAQGGGDVGGAKLHPENSVAVKTIHGSKGLEYPFIFLLHLETPFSTQDKRRSVCAAEGGLLGLTLLDKQSYQKMPTAAHAYIIYTQWLMQKSEELRLLYVALTRAKQQLFLMMDKERALKYCQGSGFLEAAPDTAHAAAARAGSMADWILLYLVHAGEGENVQSAAQGTSCRSSIAEYICWDTPLHPVEEEPETVHVLAQPDPEAAEKMRKQLAFSYTSRAAGLVSKHSVTGLSHPEKSCTEDLLTPDFKKASPSEKTGRLWGAGRGTAVHRMLEQMDFSAAREDPKRELERLQAEGRLTPQEAAAMPLDKIVRFLQSDLFGRIAASPCVYKEKQFFVVIGDLDLPEDSALRSYADTDGILIGTVDLLFREGDSWVVVDYKTDTNKSARELAEQYGLQVGLYRKAVEKITGGSVKDAYLYSFSLDAAIPIHLDEIVY